LHHSPSLLSDLQSSLDIDSDGTRKQFGQIVAARCIRAAGCRSNLAETLV
jgi:hypothetical protein